MEQKILNWIHSRPSIHLRNAFLLRKDERYEESGKELQLACNENDGEALYVMYETLIFGGFNICQTDLEHAKTFLERSKITGCKWYLFEKNVENCEEEAKNGNLMAMSSLHEDEYNDYLLLMGDADQQSWICNCKLFSCSNPNHFKIEMKSAMQKNNDGMSKIARRYERELNFTKAAYYWTLLNSVRKIRDRLEGRSAIPLEEQYIYGKWMISGGNLQNQTCITTYKEIHRKMQKAVVFWLLISKKFMCKDIGVCIGKMVWKSREEEISLWV